MLTGIVNSFSKRSNPKMDSNVSMKLAGNTNYTPPCKQPLLRLNTRRRAAPPPRFQDAGLGVVGGIISVGQRRCGNGTALSQSTLMLMGIPMM